ncbi:MAG: hypothetical protein NC204_01020 [Candidatus Amulumruptor caecigallinarius]|nr:hypothetical protein [Candidatus Amulumruptor caecigallinarius]
MAAKIHARYERINISWLITGEGEMLLDDNMEENDIAPDDKNYIPFYDSITSGSFNGRVGNADRPATLIGHIEAGGWFAGRATAAIRHIGDSMVEYPSGCILAVREVLDRSLIIPGKNYVVETSEFRVTKRIQSGSRPGFMALYSSNTETYLDGRLIHEPFEVPIESIRRIYDVLGFIVNETGEIKIIN